MTLLSTSEPLDVDGLAVPRQLLIAGNWQDASSGDTVEVINPSDASAITGITDADVEDGLAAVDAAAAALPDWSATPPRRNPAALL
jgi:succinate-semialdehyde dehydrogenase/glutarate-semialdehyde dehydrogenase